jgi:hypothetical protein
MRGSGFRRSKGAGPLKWISFVFDGACVRRVFDAFLC